MTVDFMIFPLAWDSECGYCTPNHVVGHCISFLDGGSCLNITRRRSLTIPFQDAFLARLYKIVKDCHGAHGALAGRWALANASCEKSPWGFVSRTSWMSVICGPEPNRVKARVSTDTLNERMRLRRGRPRSVRCGRPAPS